MNGTQRVTPLTGLEVPFKVLVSEKGGIKEMRIEDVNEVGNILV